VCAWVLGLVPEMDGEADDDDRELASGTTASSSLPPANARRGDTFCMEGRELQASTPFKTRDSLQSFRGCDAGYFDNSCVLRLKACVQQAEREFHARRIKTGCVDLPPTTHAAQTREVYQMPGTREIISPR